MSSSDASADGQHSLVKSASGNSSKAIRRSARFAAMKAASLNNASVEESDPDCEFMKVANKKKKTASPQSPGKSTQPNKRGKRRPTKCHPFDEILSQYYAGSKSAEDALTKILCSTADLPPEEKEIWHRHSPAIVKLISSKNGDMVHLILKRAKDPFIIDHLLFGFNKGLAQAHTELTENFENMKMMYNNESSKCARLTQERDVILEETNELMSLIHQFQYSTLRLKDSAFAYIERMLNEQKANNRPT